MPRIFDGIEGADDTGREMVRRFPEEGAGDFCLGSQPIVRRPSISRPRRRTSCGWSSPANGKPA